MIDHVSTTVETAALLARESGPGYDNRPTASEIGEPARPVGHDNLPVGFDVCSDWERRPR